MEQSSRFGSKLVNLKKYFLVLCIILSSAAEFSAMQQEGKLIFVKYLQQARYLITMFYLILPINFQDTYCCLHL